MICLIFDRKKIMITVGCVIISAFVFGAAIYSINRNDTYNSGKNVKIIVDAGHGFPDGGTVGVSGSVESELNLEIANLLRETLEGKGIEVVMTREGSDGLRDENSGRWKKSEDMNKRLKIMKTAGADLFVSIHMNHYPEKSVHGLRLFYSKKHPDIKELAELMQYKMASATGAKINTVMAADARLFLMKSPPIPSILAECGFISNPDEEAMLNNEEYKAKLAWAIAEAVEEYYIKSQYINL